MFFGAVSTSVEIVFEICQLGCENNHLGNTLCSDVVQFNYTEEHINFIVLRFTCAV